MSGKRFVTVYETEQSYGGPEEGGWWYWRTYALYSRKASSRRAAEKIAEKIRKRNPLNRHGEGYEVRVENKKELFSQDQSHLSKPYYE